MSDTEFTALRERHAALAERVHYRRATDVEAAEAQGLWERIVAEWERRVPPVRIDVVVTEQAATDVGSSRGGAIPLVAPVGRKGRT